MVDDVKLAAAAFAAFAFVGYGCTIHLHVTSEPVAPAAVGTICTSGTPPHCDGIAVGNGSDPMHGAVAIGNGSDRLGLPGTFLGRKTHEEPTGDGCNWDTVDDETGMHIASTLVMCAPRIWWRTP